MKKCTMCKESKDLEEFHKNKKKKDGYNNVCKSCRKDYHANWYLNNKECVNNHNENNKNKIRQFILDFLIKNKCTDCNESDPIVLEFDHQKDKLFNISEAVNRRFSLPKLKCEIEKCEVVCANCHRRRTAKTQNWFKELKTTS